MKHNRIFLFLTPLLLTVLYSFHSGNQKQGFNKEFTRRYSERLDSFRRSITECIIEVQKADIQKSKSKTAAMNAYKQLRHKYKRWEYLGYYMDAQFLKDIINGVPLPKPERNSFGMNILEPRGLQVVDELISEFDNNEIKTALLRELSSLQSALANYKPDFTINPADVLAASRQALIVVISMGLNGFDVPGTGNSLPDAESMLSAVWDDMQILLPLGQEHTAKELRRLFEGAITYIHKNQNFELFDRAKYTRDLLIPIYRNLGVLHKQTGYEFPHERRMLSGAVNDLSNDFFSETFFNNSFFSHIPAEIQSEELMELGKLLFYDPILSDNANRSCASCHNPKLGFADGKPKSHSFDGASEIKRNTPGLINCVYNERFFYDLRAESLIDQQEHVISDPKEFNTDYFKIIEKLSGSKAYREMFQTAFPKFQGTESLNPQNIRYAIAYYVSGLNSFNSEFDRWMRGETSSVNAEVLQGYNLFMGKAACGTCHFAPVFNGTVPPLYEETESEVLGVLENPDKKPLKLDNDAGRGAARLKEATPFYIRSFKTPTVRNITATAPYMHNGAYPTLESVMDFYNRGGGIGHGLDVPFQTLPSDRLGLSNKEMRAIIAFMKSLDDNPFADSIPSSLPEVESRPELNKRKPGGVL
ncbi:MAG: hypothetical protein KJS92_00970 [Bacteroidetes bacterium]|nr:hypothetical protein [Bacteroidota bacterium]